MAMKFIKFIMVAYCYLMQRQIEGFMNSGKRCSWPITDCHSENIDVVFVPDTSLQTTLHMNQLKLFSNLVSVFSPNTETSLNRVRVSLVNLNYNVSTNILSVVTRIAFGSFTNKTDLKNALETSYHTQNMRVGVLDGTVAILHAIFNNTSYDTRPDTIRAIIMLTQGMHILDSFKQDLMNAYTISKKMNVLIFFIVIGSETPIKPQPSFPYVSFVLAENLNSISQTHYIPIRLCKVCFSGWFNALNDVSLGTNSISCYKLYVHKWDVNWIDANEMCKKEQSELASIETVTEHKLLRNILPYLINSVSLQSNWSDDFVSVYIGLKRRLSSIGQRFRWLNQKPQVHSQWRHLQPQGGNTIACAMWDFPLKATGPAVLIRDSDNKTITRLLYSNNVLDGWSSVGCGNDVSPYFLCEAKNKGTILQRDKYQINLTEPKVESITAAIKRGELGFRSDSQQSMRLATVLALNRDFYQSSFAYVNHDIQQHIGIDNLQMFYCDNFTQIPFSMVCDHVVNCTNEADEAMCGYIFRPCDAQQQFTCNNKQCVPIEAKCDLYNDCRDGSDEEDCITCPHARCQNARCLPKHWFVDGEIDCNSCVYDGSLADEAKSVLNSKIDQCLFVCNRTKCVSRSMLNDSVVNCKGPEGELDETLGALESTTCYSDSDNISTSYTNWAPKCIYIKDRYGEPIGCRNMKHLQNCTYFVCPEGYYKCPLSYCIPTHYLKNCEYDCPDGEDEDDFTLLCPGHYRCSNSKVCLHPDHVCDGQVDCPRGDDEVNCHVICREGFLCLAGTVTVNGYNKAIPLTDLDFVDPSTRYLDLSGVNVSAVFPIFPSQRLTNVVNLSLSGCSITSVESRYSINHNDIRSMWWVDLSYNLIPEAPAWTIFKSMFALQFLNLSHNEHLTFLAKEAFSPFRMYPSVLRVLDLSYTSLSSVHSGLLNLNSLNTLILRNTKIVEIPQNMFPRLLTLHFLDLRGLTLNELYPDMFKNVTIKFALFTDSFKLCCPQLHNDDTDVKVCVSAKDPFSSCSDLMSDMILRVLLWVSGVLAVVGNTSVIVYRLYFDKLIFRMAYGHYIMHLSFADLFMGIYLMIIATADTYYRNSYVWDEYVWRNSVSCEVAGFLSTLSSETSTFFIFLITVDRFFAMRFPFRQLKSSGKLITLVCIITWALGLSIASMPLLPYFKDWNVYRTNGMCLALPLTNIRQAGWQFSTAIFIFLNFILFIMIAFGQLAIYKSVFSMRMSQSKLSNASYRRAQDMAIAKNLFLVVITDFMCWFPIGVMGLLALSGHEIGAEAYAWSAILVLPINSAINPLLYTVPAVAKKLKLYKDSVKNHTTKSH